MSESEATVGVLCVCKSVNLLLLFPYLYFIYKRNT